MDLIPFDFLVYSSHKTSTQTLVSTLKLNNFKALHCHILFNLKNILNTKNHISKEIFIKYLIDYKNKNKKKFKIIT